jgi:hypothetical protein
MKLLICLAASTAVTACGAMNTYKTPTILATGQDQVLAALQMHGAQATPEMSVPMPELAIGYRRGVHEKLEVDVTATILPLGKALTATSVELAAKMPIARRGRWEVAVSGAVGYRLAISGGAAFETGYVAVPLIAGVHLGKYMLVLSPMVSYQRLYSSGTHPFSVPAAGAAVGGVLQLGKHWALMPEVMWSASPTRNLMDGDSALFHLGVAVGYTRD